MDFLKSSTRTSSADTAAQPVTAGGALREAPPETSLRLSAGSWGKDGDFSMWLNPETEWTWTPVGARGALLERRSAAPFSAGMRAPSWSRRRASCCWRIVRLAVHHLHRRRRRLRDQAVQSSTATRSRRCCPSSRPASDLAAAPRVAAELQAIDGPFPDLIGAIAAASDVTAH